MGWAAKLCECDKIENYKKEIEENTYICKHHKTDHLFICKNFPNEGVMSLLCFLGENSQITPFRKLCCNLPLFWKYVRIYYCFGTWVWRNQVFHDTRIPWKNFENFLEYIFSKNLSFWNSSFMANLSFKKVVDPYIFTK